MIDVCIWLSIEDRVYGSGILILVSEQNYPSDRIESRRDI